MFTRCCIYRFTCVYRLALHIWQIGAAVTVTALIYDKSALSRLPIQQLRPERRPYCFIPVRRRNSSWWRHQIETFSALLALCARNSPVTGEFPPQRPVMRSFDVFFDLRPNKRLSKQSWGWCFQTPSCSLWRHCNADKEAKGSSNYLPFLKRLFVVT